MEIVVTDGGRITVYPVHLYKGHLKIKVASRCGLGRKPNKKLSMDCGFVLSSASSGTLAAMREKKHLTAEGGDYLQILKVKVETGVGSLLLAIIQSLEPHSGRFF